MINGRFAVYGTPSYLKEKYGYGYIVKMFLKHSETSNVNIELKLALQMKEFKLDNDLERLGQIDNDQNEIQFHLKAESNLKLSELIKKLMQLEEKGLL